MPVEHKIGPGRSRHLRLLLTAHRRRHPCPRPLRKKDRCIADGACSSLDEDPLAAQVAVGEQAAMRCHRRNAERRSNLEGYVVGQPDGLRGGNDNEFRRRPESAATLRHVDPDALADARRRHARTDGVDDARAVLMRHDPWERHGLSTESSPRLDVGRIDA